jgi:hypothetical protein
MNNPANTLEPYHPVTTNLLVVVTVLLVTRSH